MNADNILKNNFLTVHVHSSTSPDWDVFQLLCVSCRLVSWPLVSDLVWLKNITEAQNMSFELVRLTKNPSCVIVVCLNVFILSCSFSVLTLPDTTSVCILSLFPGCVPYACVCVWSSVSAGEELCVTSTIIGVFISGPKFPLLTVLTVSGPDPLYELRGSCSC